MCRIWQQSSSAAEPSRIFRPLEQQNSQRETVVVVKNMRPQKAPNPISVKYQNTQPEQIFILTQFTEINISLMLGFGLADRTVFSVVMLQHRHNMNLIFWR